MSMQGTTKDEWGSTIHWRLQKVFDISAGSCKSKKKRLRRKRDKSKAGDTKIKIKIKIKIKRKRKRKRKKEKEGEMHKDTIYSVFLLFLPLVDILAVSHTCLYSMLAGVYEEMENMRRWII